MPRLFRLFILIPLLAMSGQQGECRQVNDDVITFAGATIITPDPAVNAELASGRLHPTTVVDVRVTPEGLVVNPLLRPGWTWLVAKGIRVNGTPLGFAFIDGRLYSDVMLKTLHRRMKFLKDVSAHVQGAAWVIAFYRENVIERELVIFGHRPGGGADVLTIGREVFGLEKTAHIRYDRQGFGHVSVLRMADEYRPWFIPAQGPAVRQRLLLNAGWLFHKGDVPQGSAVGFRTSGWDSVQLPHCWNTTDVYDERNTVDGFEVHGGYYRGPGWYRKELRADKAWTGRVATLHFEGAFQKTDVWLNGQHLGTHRGGYTGFTFDVTNVLVPGGVNVIAVRVDNAFDDEIPPHTADYAMYGGLYRDVTLTVAGPTGIEGPVTVTPVVHQGEEGGITVDATVGNRTGAQDTVVMTGVVVDQRNEIVASFGRTLVVPAHSTTSVRVSSDTIRGLNLWSPGRPVLYTVRSRISRRGLLLDEVTTRIGFRWFRFHPDSGFTLNGVPLRLKGVNRHQDYPLLGIAVPDSLHVRDMAMIKELGANFVRLAHYPQDPSVLDACDSLGLLVWEEIPVVNSVGGSAFAENAMTMMREMIERDRHHPSVILWGLANECLAEYAEAGAIPRVTTLLTRLHSLARRLDPTRLTAQAHNDLLVDSVASITDVMGRNRYFGWYTEDMREIGPALDKEHQENPSRILLVSEYGAEAKRGYHVTKPVRFDHSEDYQLQFHEHYWNAIVQRPFVSGSALWTAFDFCSPFKVGNVPRVNQKGIWDSWRKPKELYYFYKSQWSTDPMVHIVPFGRTEYPEVQAGGPVEVTVYSNCDRVELFINGEPAGALSGQPVFRWRVRLREGGNLVRAVGYSNSCIVTESSVIRHSVGGALDNEHRIH